MWTEKKTPMIRDGFTARLRMFLFVATTMATPAVTLALEVPAPETDAQALVDAGLKRELARWQDADTDKTLSSWLAQRSTSLKYGGVILLVAAGVPMTLTGFAFLAQGLRLAFGDKCRAACSATCHQVCWDDGAGPGAPWLVASGFTLAAGLALAATGILFVHKAARIRSFLDRQRTARFGLFPAGNAGVGLFVHF